MQHVSCTLEDGGTTRMGEVAVGTGVLTRGEQLWLPLPQGVRLTRDEGRLREVRLWLGHEDGSWVDIVLLRSIEWLERHESRVGGCVYLDLPEMGAEGKALVRSIGPCPPLARGTGALVTGTFRHSEAEVMELRVQGEHTPLVGTRSHPVWSADREDWVPLEQLRLGERLLARDGSTPEVRGLVVREQLEPVVNLEVDGDHCYRVGQQGVLVHNMSQPTGDDSAEGQDCSCGTIDPPNPCTAAGIPIPTNVNNTFPKASAVVWTPTNPDIMIGLPARGDELTPGASTTEMYVYGKITQVVARVSLRSGGPGGSGWASRVVKWYGASTTAEPLADNIGHIIDAQFGGKASNAATDFANRNFFPQNKERNDRLNRLNTEINAALSGWRRADGTTITKSSERCNRRNPRIGTACIQVEIMWPSGNTLRPTGFTYNWWWNGQYRGGISADNPNSTGKTLNRY